MLDYKDTLRYLTAIPSISGCEKYAAEKIREKFGDLFDEIYTDMARNIILVKKSKKTINLLNLNHQTTMLAV